MSTSSTIAASGALRRAATLRAARHAGLVLALAAPLAGCKLIEADTHNLDELHGADGRHRYSAALEGDLEYVFRHKLGALVPGAKLAEGQKPEPVENPSKVCLKKLVRLASYSPSTPGVASRQVEWFARLAVDDPYVLSRERALIELGEAARRLDVGPRGLAEDAVPAGPAALSEALASLARAARAVRSTSSRERSREALAADLDAAAMVLTELELDLDGARRALLVTSELLQARGLFGTASPTLVELDLHLQRVCVERALARALLDETPFVRAAALEAVARARGPDVLAPVLVRIPFEPTEVAARALRLVTELGLPSPEALSEAERAELGLQDAPDYLAAIYRVIETFRDEGLLRVKAMQALGAATASGPRSLREEDWQAWWYAREDERRGAAGGAALAGGGPGLGRAGRAGAP